MARETDLLIERSGRAGIITLNRPEALNAVTQDMVARITDALERWRDDSEVTRVVIKAAGERAFSAGGDLRHLYDLGRSGRTAEALDFWRREYTLNASIKRYPKPYVALIDGIVMGGGVGVSIHGSHRIAGDRFRFAMPEVGIGFFPDVGATWFLPRLPGELGTYCALTGDRLDAGEAIASGLATHRVASSRFAELEDALCGDAPVEAILANHAASIHDGPLSARRAAIDRIFAAPHVDDILALLDSEARSGGVNAEWAAATASAIRGKAPRSLKIARAQMRRGRSWSFEECMQAEMRIVSRVAYGYDFYEGIRAVIIDKDNRPRWRPPTLAEVSEAEVEDYLAPIDAELAL